MPTHERRTLKGSVSITRVTCSHQPDYIRILFRDATSGVEFAEASMTLENFGKAVTGQGDMPVDLDVRMLDAVGMIRETKTENVTVPDHEYDHRQEAARLAVEPFEVDGWIGCASNALNRHRLNDDGTYRVGFHRFVAVDSPE